jgi:hypothetical protein
MVHVRILLYIVAGWLFSSGYVSAEIRDVLTNDPEAAAMVQAALSAVVAGASWLWWRLAKRFGWDT